MKRNLFIVIALISSHIFAWGVVDELGLRANAGDAQAMSKLGSSYEYGQGVDRDLSMALAWYKKAKEAGCANMEIAIDRVSSMLRWRKIIIVLTIFGVLSCLIIALLKRRD